MNSVIDSLIILILTTNLMLLASSRLGACINILAFQGIIIGLLPLMGVAGGSFDLEAGLISCLIIAVKGFVFPGLLKYTIRTVNVRKEVEPYVGYTSSILIGVIALALASILCRNIVFPVTPLTAMAPIIGVFSIFCGLFIIVSRIKAVTQVMGYIVFENGIYLVGTALALKQAFIVELGIMLDVIVVVFIMGIMMFHINREFDHIDTNNLK